VTEPYGRFNSADSECERHGKFGQRYDVVPVKYHEVPRGRVEYDINESKFHLYGNSCILADRNALNEIGREFRLSSANTQEPECDPRYGCPGCIRPTATNEPEERGMRDVIV
jgi:hypothetical protein